MTKKQKKALHRIIISAALCAACFVLCRFVALPRYAQLVLWLAPYLVVGLDVLEDSVKGILAGQVFDESFLMAIATVGAFALGEYSEGVAVMLFYQIGELFQSCAVSKSRKSISDLMDIRPDSANLQLEDGSLEEVDPADVAQGSVIVIRPGERVPLDGEVLTGESLINTAALTGESKPRSVKAGDSVLSGCVNMSGLITVRTTCDYDSSTAARILELVENSSLKKARTEAFITRFAHWYTPAVCIAAAALALVPPIFVGNFKMWVSRALTFLVISCPCALVISVPLAFFGAIGGASRKGILVKGGTDLENLAKLSSAVFDKTGTLTKGEFSVFNIECADGVDEEQLLTLAASAETHSSHPIAAAIREKAKNYSVSAPAAVTEISGRGVKADVDGHTVLAGSKKLLTEQNVPCPDLADIAGSSVYVAKDGEFIGRLLLADLPKEGAKDAIAKLKAKGLRCVMLTGDDAQAAEAVANEVGMDEFHAQLLPADKVTLLEQILENKKKDSTVAFVGDGINDAPALMRADVGVAMGALGSDAAIEAADVVIMDDQPEKLSLAVTIAKKCVRIIRQNIAFALTIKALFLLLGALGVAGMWWAVFSDVGVMVLAVLNSTRLLAAATDK